MEITYTPTGQRIVFRGADDPLKLKGVKFTKGYHSIDAVRYAMIEDVLRG